LNRFLAPFFNSIVDNSFISSPPFVSLKHMQDCWLSSDIAMPYFSGDGNIVAHEFSGW